MRYSVSCCIFQKDLKALKLAENFYFIAGVRTHYDNTNYDVLQYSCCTLFYFIFYLMAHGQTPLLDGDQLQRTLDHYAAGVKQ